MLLWHMKLLTSGYFGFKITIKLWAAPWPDASWKWNYKYKGRKETEVVYRRLWGWLRLLYRAWFSVFVFAFAFTGCIAFEHWAFILLLHHSFHIHTHTHTHWRRRMVWIQSRLLTFSCLLFLGCISDYGLMRTMSCRNVMNSSRFIIKLNLCMAPHIPWLSTWKSIMSSLSIICRYRQDATESQIYISM